MKGIHEAGCRWTRLLVGMMAIRMMSGCTIENVRVFPEPWQNLDPGKPPENRPKVEIVSQGKGPEIEAGDLVQISTKFWSAKEGRFYPAKEWWLWIGFKSKKETPFFSSNPAQRSALLGLKAGAVIKYLEHKDNTMDAGELFINPLGDSDYYSWRKNKKGFGKIFTPYESGYTQVEITRVCKGQAQYRTLRLFDDSWVERCSWAPIHCEMIDSPREGWVDEAKIEALCSDGQTATFQYGPVASRNGKEWRGPVNPENYFNPWEKAAWDKLPVGVQLK